MRIALLRTPLVLLAALILQSCAGSRGVLLPDLSDLETRKSVLESIDRWEFSGRIGVSAGEEGFNGKIRWWQEGDDFRATVSGPLGVGTVKIEGQGRRITLTDKKGEVTELQDAEIDLRLRYGWTIPVSSLQFWALGIPDPLVPAEVRMGDDGLIAEMQQGNWHVIIGEYREGGGQQMPRRLSASNADAKVRLVIDNWKFEGG
jgi:outer membrane lipoprotein LolB